MSKETRSLGQFLASKKGQILLNFLYSWGAAVVIFGAMCKIMHFGGAGDYILMGGMIVETIVFLISGFDYSSSVAETESVGVVMGGAIAAGSAVGSTVSGTDDVLPDPKKAKGGSGTTSPVVIIGGGSSGTSGGGSVSPIQGSSSGTNVSPVSGTGATGGTVPEYSHSLSNTAQNLEEFSNTIHSLNEVSRKMLDAYKQITETQGFTDNIATLNQNVSGLNEVFNSQLQTITEQMSAIRYINDSLLRMKNLYDGAIGDSYMFREESAKMTKHIEALNNVYARLLQAMTTNNNNTNTNNF
ncbi:MAG: gliding motility protein GldL [Prevotella sp.]|jgi:uncharacterized protein YukE|nr:gliding motility protein GldL [Prevotella sp.]